MTHLGIFIINIISHTTAAVIQRYKTVSFKFWFDLMGGQQAAFNINKLR